MFQRSNSAVKTELCKVGAYSTLAKFDLLAFDNAESALCSSWLGIHQFDNQGKAIVFLGFCTILFGIKSPAYPVKLVHGVKKSVEGARTIGHDVCHGNGDEFVAIVNV